MVEFVVTVYTQGVLKMSRFQKLVAHIDKEKRMLIPVKNEGNPSTCIHKHLKQTLLLLEQKHILMLT